jgi:hypothetical protein
MFRLKALFYSRPGGMYWDSGDLSHSRRKQRTDQRVLVLTLKFLVLKISPIKILPKFFLTFVYPFSMQHFNAAATMFSKKNLFAHKKLKKTPSKVAHNQPKPFISQSSPAHSPQPRIDFSNHKISGTSICSLICAVGILRYINHISIRGREDNLIELSPLYLKMFHLAWSTRNC